MGRFFPIFLVFLLLQFSIGYPDMESQMMMHPTDYIYFTGQLTCKHLQTPTIQALVLWEHNSVSALFLPFQQLSLDQTVHPYRYDIKARAFGDGILSTDYEFYLDIIHNCSYFIESRQQKIWYQHFNTGENITFNMDIKLE
ncbi:hypothetical protein GCK72_025974 [Caenorhabditis remanei]|uniref:Uncharacterized protein n=1 Tax=Caenorhabditis remanei TaxID=31234 RepID=A0A6A5G3M3_CAERE|nr:hypothetical protein GCK72_025974 [Caenorhabditis remanei]KAF1749506.1 hypothetical protein GCK72_025974 [Caenorhabditis remanei]